MDLLFFSIIYSLSNSYGKSCDSKILRKFTILLIPSPHLQIRIKHAFAKAIG